MDRYVYSIVSPIEVVDGDTVDCTVDLGFKIYHKVRVRLEGYDAPEIFKPKSSEERAYGGQVKEYLKACISKPGNYLLKSNKLDKYGRSLGTVYFTENETFVSINDMIKSFMSANKPIK